MMTEDFSQLTKLQLTDLVKDRDIPEHLLALLEMHEYESTGELRDHIAEADEDEREAIWSKADRCALMRVLLPYHNPDGTVSKVGRRVVGWLAYDLGVSGQSIRRYINLGINFPPEIKQIDDETGEVETRVIRDPSMPMNLYYTALTAEDYGLSPLQAVLHAMDHDPRLTAGQLGKWIREESWRAEGKTPPVRREWFSYRVEDQPDLNEVEALVENALDSIRRAYIVLGQKGKAPLSVSITINALEPADDPIGDAEREGLLRTAEQVERSEKPESSEPRPGDSADSATEAASV